MIVNNKTPNTRVKKRVKIIFQRCVRAVLSFCFCIFVISLMVNKVLDATIDSQISGIVKGVMSEVQFDSTEEAIAARNEVIQQARKIWNLDAPFFRRVLLRCFDIVSLNLGYSSTMVTSWPENSRKVSLIVKEQLPHSLILFTSSSILAIIFSLFLGTEMASKNGQKLDKTLRMASLMANGVPSWLLGSLMVLIFAYVIPIFKVGKLHTPCFPYKGILFVFDYLYYMLLPFLALFIVKVGSYSYLIRSMVMTPLQEDFVVAARGRGIKEKNVIYKHGLRVIAPSIVTMSAQAVAQSIAGDILVEIIMCRPGIGYTFYKALLGNDVSLIIGILSVITIIYCCTYAILDVIYTLLDPRIESAT